MGGGKEESLQEGQLEWNLEKGVIRHEPSSKLSCHGTCAGLTLTMLKTHEIDQQLGGLGN
jgi:hypothetical protein